MAARKPSGGLGAPLLYLNLNLDLILDLDLGPSVRYCNLRTGPTCPARQTAIYNVESRMEWLAASGRWSSHSAPLPLPQP
jgi:hypothetical protein